MKRTLNDRMVKALKPALPGQRYDAMDTVVPGFGIRVTDTGQRTYMLRCRYPGSVHANRRALGDCGAISLEAARVKARMWLELIKKGVDPQIQEERERQAELRQQGTTFAAVAEDFIREKLPGERKGREVERDIRRELIPAWGRRPIADIAPLDVRYVIKAVKERGAPYQAHNLLVTVRRMFSWAIDQHVYGLETSPCDRLKPKAIIGKKMSRTRILDNEELRAVWRATRRIGYPYGPLYQLLLLSGQRKSEVAEARWSEFDMQGKLWTIPGERMKGEGEGAPHAVPLTTDMIAILEALPRFRHGDHVFSTTFGRKPVNGFSKAKDRIDARMLRTWRALGRVNDKDRRKTSIPGWVNHDLRRTVRTNLSRLPVQDVVRELIAHARPGLHKVYDLYAYLDEKRQCLELWSARLRTIVEPPPPNVVPLKGVRL
jgi:integrase